MSRPHLLQLGVVAALSGVAGLAFAPVYASNAYPLVAFGAAIASVGLWLLMATKAPRREGLAILVSLGGYVLFAANTVLRSSVLVVVPTPETFDDLADGLINGWARLMTTAIPVADDPSISLLGPTLVWVAGFVAAWLAVKHTAVLLPLVPPVIVVGIGVFFAGPRSGASLGVVALFVGLALVLLLLRTLRPARSLANVSVSERQVQGGRLVVQVDDEEPADTPEAAASRRRQALFGIAVAVVVMVLAPLVGPRIPLSAAREPVDPRDLTDLPPEDRDDVSPLVQLRSLLEREPEEVFSVRPDGLPAYWRLAVLEDFDGSLWTLSSSVEPSGTEVAPDEDLDVPTERLAQDVEIVSLEGSWLPAADRAATVTGAGEDRVLVDPDTGTLLLAEGDSEGLTYRVVSERPLISSGAQGGATVPVGPEVEALTELPEPVGAEAQDRREDIVAEAEAATAEQARPFAQAVALQQRLREGPTAVRTAPSGHGYGSVHSLLFGAGGEPTSGSAEQIASAFAIMARAIGLPSRVAVGFLPGTADAEGTYRVSSADAWAWPEVWFDGLGWVPFEPTRPPTADEAAAIEEQLAQQAAVDEAVAAATGGAEDGRLTGGGGEDQSTRRALYAVLLLVVLALLAVVGFLVTISLLRRRRRRRRSIGTPAQRVVGAYREALDDLNEAGLRGTRAMTAAELAARTEAEFGLEAAQHLRPLGNMANLALFAGRDLPPQQADEAWAHVTRLESTLVAGQRRSDRVRRRVDPRLLARST